MQEPHRNAGGISQWRLLPAVTLAAKTATSSMPVNFVTRADPMASMLGINRPVAKASHGAFSIPVANQSSLTGSFASRKSDNGRAAKCSQW